MDLYRDAILDHYHNPRNFGHLNNPDNVIEENNVSCGDRVVMEIQLKNNDSGTIIEDIRFSGEGCAINQAAASMLTEKVKGQLVMNVKKMGLSDILALLKTELTPSRIKCAILPLEVLQKAIITKI